MKFAHEFKAALEQGDFPEHWKESAVPYPQLKKCLKKIQKELESLGLTPETLAELAAQNDHGTSTTQSDRRGSSSGFQYNINDGATVLPKLTLFVQLEDGAAVDASLTPNTRRYLSNLVSRQHGLAARGEYVDTASESSEINDSQSDRFRRIEVPLTFDAEFFDILREDVTTLDNLQAQEEKNLCTKIETLSTDLRALARPPSKFHKSDLHRWRELFDLYTQAGIFFSTHELDHGSRNSTKAAQQLQWFQGEVMKRKIVDNFKLPESRRVLKQFVDINISLLLSLKFQEINEKAVLKIMKKFDKRTHLNARRALPMLIKSDSIRTSSMAMAVCSQMSQDLLQVVPQLEDYKCPICLGLAWRPIRMRCNHVLCIECTIQLQRDNKKFCPLCREPVVMEAGPENIDHEMEKYVEKYFPREVREALIARETADGIARFGSSYKHPSESKCNVM